MKKSLFICSLLFSLVCLISCSSIQYDQSKHAQACNIGVVKISANFATARMDKCTQVADNEYLITLVPENTPINSSPWYAFKVWSETTKNIQLKITYNQGVSHRYYPKLSFDKKQWANVDSTSFLSDTASINILATTFLCSTLCSKCSS